MNQLFDRVEGALKGHPEQMFFKSILGGKITQQIISKVAKLGSLTSQTDS